MNPNLNPLFVAVTSPSFSSNSILVDELRQSFPHLRLNCEKKELRGQSLLSFLQNSEAAIIGRECIDALVLDSLPQLSCISKYGVGIDNIDLEYSKKRGVYVGFQPGTNRRSVAELVLCFLLGLAHHIFFRYLDLKQGLWLKEGGEELSKKSVGIIGCGNIGSELVKLLLPFQCSIFINDIVDKSEFIAEQKKLGQKIQQLATKEEIYASCDFISLHLPLTQATEGMIDTRALKQMKKSAYLINTSRGRIVDEPALKKALDKGQIAGAALDVFVEEPIQDKDLLKLPNLVLSPHIGGSTEEAVLAMGRAAIAELKKWKEIRALG